jgi:5-methylcytosine-specific restriction enzyme subunit McrC
MRVDLVENGDACEVVLAAATGVALAETGFVDARPIAGSPLWSLRPVSKVGAVAIGEIEVHVRPKVPIDRVVHLLEYGLAGVRWRDEAVEVEQARDLLTAVAEVYERVCRRALRRGLLQGYRVVEEALPLVRGRIREADQLRIRFGLPVPVEVRYDDFTVDTPENRWLRAGVRRCLLLPGISRGLRHRLVQLDVVLADVTFVRPAAGLERWRPTRLNARLHDALHLAEVIVRASSFEARGAGLNVSGFILDMARVFEDFVCTALGEQLRRRGGEIATQDPWFLDRNSAIRMKPDLVWYRDGSTPAAVIDAKYKAEKPDGFPDADLYQMLAYCTALALPCGHLVYAKGNQEPARHNVTNADVEIVCHALDLAQEPRALLAQVASLATAIASGAREEAPSLVASGATQPLAAGGACLNSSAHRDDAYVTKYDELREHLRRQHASSLMMTFEEIAAMVPGGLPQSAYNHQAWWANQEAPGHPHGRAWLDAGFRTTALSLTARRVTFVR